ncbi:MAG: HPr(Ser) kinase/phosphatase [Kiritimatiellae bacterium]|nr:HPr(Ser) kinase/phosphatase [Kiritimatiellia bacterium]
MPLTVRRFWEAGRDPLGLNVECGEEHLDRPVPEGVLNRPGLALAGFMRYFAHHRIQVLGLAEMTYLKNLSPEECSARLRAFFKADIPCLILSRHLRPLPGMLDMAQAHRVPVLRSPMITGHFVRAAAAIIEDITMPTTRYQGTMVDIQGIGVILEGAPGVGKSETALSLISHGCSLVADDLVELRCTRGGEITGRAADVTRYHMEIRGLGIIHVPSLFGVTAVRREKRLDMIIRLDRMMNPSEEERTGLAQNSREVLGVSVPYYVIPVASGRDITNVVEAAALNFRLRQLGHDAAKELDQKLMDFLSSGHLKRRGD